MKEKEMPVCFGEGSKTIKKFKINKYNLVDFISKEPFIMLAISWLGPNKRVKSLHTTWM